MIECRVMWKRGEASFLDQRYSRAHRWEFDGGAVVPASSSPDIVPVPMSDVTAVDPEEAFVASLSSCHMLWFLAIAAKRKFVVDAYLDDARAEMGKDDRGKMVVTEVVLRPTITWGGEVIPSHEEIASLHHQAHEECFLANSVKTRVRVECNDPA